MQQKKKALFSPLSPGSSSALGIPFKQFLFRDNGQACSRRRKQSPDSSSALGKAGCRNVQLNVFSL